MKVYYTSSSMTISSLFKPSRTRTHAYRYTDTPTTLTTPTIVTMPTIVTTRNVEVQLSRVYTIGTLYYSIYYDDYNS